MKQLLIVQHAEKTPPCSTLDWCVSRAITPVIQKAWIDQSWPANFESFLGVVICGGGMNVDQENLYPWLIAEKSMIRGLLSSGVKTLGLCLGAQLMAEALNAKVGPHSHWEIGWHTIQLGQCEFFPQETSNVKGFQWHRYTFETPINTVKLGSSDACQNQAFLYKNHGLAFQFHPEADKSWITECAKEDPNSTHPEGPFVQATASILDQIQLQEPLQKWYWQVLDLFFLNKKISSPLQ